MSREKKTAVGVATPATEIDKQSTDIINQAIEKINPKSIKNANRYMKVVAEPVAKALHGFCRQSEEFARAITETDVTFQECLEAITKGIGQALSDIDTYQRAVEYYFPGAKIEFKMTIRMSEYDLEEPESRTAKPEPALKKNIDLSLDSLLDW